MGELAGTHDLKRVVITVNGRRIRGGAESDLITIAYDEDKYTKTYGSTGRPTRSRTNADGGTFTISLAQNDIEDIRYLDSLNSLPSPLDIVAIVVQDAETLVMIGSDKCWLKKQPDEGLNKAAGSRVYVFDTGQISKRHLGV